MAGMMDNNRFYADYPIETPLDPMQVAEVMAGEQSCGTFVRVQGETEQLRERARAVVVSVEVTPTYRRHHRTIDRPA